MAAIAHQVNPFQQSVRYWRLSFALPVEVALRADEYFTDGALSVASVEIEDTPHLWRMEVLYEAEPSETETLRRLRALAQMEGINAPPYTLEVLAAQDWAAAIHYQFPPLKVGRFFIHGSHITPPFPHGCLPIRVDAGLAFGSGEHATTSGCLRMLESLPLKENILDMGTGSGILAIASAKLWPGTYVMAADIDPVAVKVAAENIRINRVARQVRAVQADSYFRHAVAAYGPYDVILANILARPLMKLAKGLAANLAPQGRAVLSGLLVSQENMVLSAHREHGLYLKKRLRLGGWSTLLIGRE